MKKNTKNNLPAHVFLTDEIHETTVHTFSLTFDQKESHLFHTQSVCV